MVFGRKPGKKAQGGAAGVASVSMKYRPSPSTTGDSGGRGQGKQPLAEAASVTHILSMMLVHLARKALYGVDVSHKVGMYVVGILVLSVISDFSPAPTHYMSRPNNFFNVYFVKFGWGWTLLVSGLFVSATSYTYSCGNAVVVKNQLTRLALATGVWYGVTGAFLVVEEHLGICDVGTKFLNKAECLDGGFRWKGFDVSGHCFLLVWNGLFIVEEARAYLGWERIRDMIRNEEYLRLNAEPGSQEQRERATVLSRLSLNEFLHLRRNYLAYTPLVRVLFCLMASLVVLWDVMLVCTALYFHIMIEKVVACCAAVLIWFVLYRGIYVHPWSPGLPGEGPFKYVSFKVKQQAFQKKQESRARAAADSAANSGGGRWSRKDDLPKFMGMPLYGLNNQPKDNAASEATSSEASDVLPPSSSGPQLEDPLARSSHRRQRSRSSGSSSRFSLPSGGKTRSGVGAKYN